MTEKPRILTEQIVSNVINLMMDKCGNDELMRMVFEKMFIKEGYKLDWNKRLVNGEWKDKEELFE